MRIFFINLDRSPDRLAEFVRVNHPLSDAARSSAIDGRTLDIPTLVQHGLATEDILDHQTLGELGCSLSHTVLWEHAVLSGECTTLCEDDAIFNRQFERCAQDVINMLPADWDIVLWGWNFDMFMCFEMLPGISNNLSQFEQERMCEATELFQEQSLSPRAFKLLWAFGTPCYSVSPKGAATLREQLVPFRAMTVPCPEGLRASPHMPYFRANSIDGALNSVYRELNAFVCFPPLVVTKNDSRSSTIRAG